MPDQPTPDIDDRIDAAISGLYTTGLEEFVLIWPDGFGFAYAIKPGSGPTFALRLREMADAVEDI